MTTTQLRAGINAVTFAGTSELPFSSLPTALKNAIAQVFTVSPNGQGYISGTMTGQFGITSFKPKTDGTSAGYIIRTNSAVLVDPALFSASAASPDTLQFTAGSSDPLVTVFASVQTTGVSLSGGAFTAGTGTLEVRVNNGDFGTLASANTALAAASNPRTITARITRTTSTAATATLTVSY